MGEVNVNGFVVQQIHNKSK